MHQALYRKYRPQTFDDVWGQDHITSILQYEVANEKPSHAYLFSGSRGVGKTTCAKILAKAVNCEHPKNGNPCGECAFCRAIDAGTATDVVEMDAASNNGVDDIRVLRDEVNFLPSFLRYRVYIIDEVHMLSISAFNALLKTLEEPPEHVIFILATTELQKLPPTIVSRCQRHEFHRISTDVLAKRLLYVAEQEGIVLEKDAARLLGRLSQGGMRDALGLLETCSGGEKEVTVDRVNETVGRTGREKLFRLTYLIYKKDYEAILEEVDRVVRSSGDLSLYVGDLTDVWRDMLIVRTLEGAGSQGAQAYLDLADTEYAQLRKCTSLFTRERLQDGIEVLGRAWTDMQRGNALRRTVLEMSLFRLCDLTLSAEPGSMLARISQLEERMTGWNGRVPEAEEMPAAPQEERKPDEPRPVENVPEKKINVPVPGEPEPKPADGQESEWKLFRGWSEVMERIEAKDAPLSMMLRKARAFTNGQGEFLIRVWNPLGYSRITTGSEKEKVYASIRAVAGREIPDDRIRVEQITPQQAEEDEARGELWEDLNT